MSSASHCEMKVKWPIQQEATWTAGKQLAQWASLKEPSQTDNSEGNKADPIPSHSINSRELGYDSSKCKMNLEMD